VLISAETTFEDVTGGVHAENIVTLLELGVLEGTECAAGRFCPDDAMERSTMAVWMVRALGLEPSGSPNGFDDVDSAEWWAPYTQRLSEIGVTRGCATAPLRYCPDALVSRGQMAAFLERAFELEQPAAGSAGFTDVVDNVFVGSIEALAASGITSGCSAQPLRFCPDEPVSRAQMATFLARALANDAAVDFGDIPDVTVYDMSGGRDRDLRSYHSGDRDLMLWFFAPW